jgi:hypothetical protein
MEQEMATELALIEPLALPEIRVNEHRVPRLGQMPSLPGWAASQLALLREESQPSPTTGRYRSVLTLPAAYMPTAAQRNVMEKHMAALVPILSQTPNQNADYEAATLVLVTNLMLALPGQRTSETGAEAKGDAYMMALDDLPSWAVESAIRGWHRGESTKIGKEPHDFRWLPAPAVLRKLAWIEEWKVRSRMDEMRKILNAEERIEFTDDQRAANLKRLSGVMHGITDPKPMQEAAE